jgi:predicted transcriptional regulator YdeE
MSVETSQITLPALLITGIEVRTANRPGRAEVDIQRIWERFLGERLQERIPDLAGPELIAVYHSYESDFRGEYTYLLGGRVTKADSTPLGMVTRSFPSALYQHFDAKGTFPDNLLQVWEHIWLGSYPRTYSADLEIYGAEAFQPVSAIEVFIGVRE